MTAGRCSNVIHGLPCQCKRQLHGCNDLEIQERAAGKAALSYGGQTLSSGRVDPSSLDHLSIHAVSQRVDLVLTITDIVKRNLPLRPERWIIAIDPTRPVALQ